MQTYFIKRFLLLFLNLLGITIVSFVMLQLTPGSPLDMKAARGVDGGLAENSNITDEHREALKKLYNLDKPIHERYFLWIKDIVQLDFGTSFTDHRPVIEKIKERLPVSLIFGFSAIFMAIFVGIPMGLLGAAFHNTPIDRFSSLVVVAMYSFPSYVLGVLLITFFGNPDFFDWFPIIGIQSDNYEYLSVTGKILDRASHFVLPCICYSIGSVAVISQIQRGQFLDALYQDYVRTARAKGVSEFLVLMKHAFRNSLIQVATILGGMVPVILGGSIIIETLFSIQGLGELAFRALLERDYPTIMANFTIFSLLSLFGILVSDVLYVVIDPRIDFEG